MSRPDLPSTAHRVMCSENFGRCAKHEADDAPYVQAGGRIPHWCTQLLGHDGPHICGICKEATDA